MHELSIANSILEAVRAETARLAGSRVGKVGLRIGELSGVNPDALQFCVESLVKDSPLDPLQLEIKFCPQRQECVSCGRQFSAVDFDTRCPFCACEHTKCISGTEMDLSFLELEEP